MPIKWMLGENLFSILLMAQSHWILTYWEENSAVFIPFKGHKS